MPESDASNAYTWWSASHIRTKQSKWLDSNLQEMEEKIKAMLKIIEEDADSFAKKAEMYYKRRPELLAFVEETYKSYRAMAERYDHISGELHKANNTIATVFPDQLHYEMDDEDDDTSANDTTADPTKSLAALPPNQQDLLIDGVQSSLQKLQIHKRTESQASGQEEIDKLQKGILALQTEKEFVKSSYESGMAKYWDIEKRIAEMREELCSLQDGISAATVIEDDKARAMMAVTGLKSCEDSLVNLHERQKQFSEEAKLESQRIKNARDKLRPLKSRYGLSDASTVESSTAEEISGEEACDVKHDRLELQSVCENVKKIFEINSDISTLDLSEKIDRLLSKVVDLETTISSQKAQIQILRLESDELQKHLHSLEEEKMHLVDDTRDLSEKLRQAEEELCRVQDLDKHVRDGGVKVKAHFTEAYNALNDLSDRLQTPRKTDDDDDDDFPRGEMETLKSAEELQNEDLDSSADADAIVDVDHPIESINSGVSLPNWQQSFLDGLDDAERILLTEYTSIIWNYKQANGRWLIEAEKKNHDHLFDTMAQMRDLKNANVMKDEEIHSLLLKLGFLEACLNDRGEDVKFSPSRVGFLEACLNDRGEDVKSRILRVGTGEAPLLSTIITTTTGDPLAKSTIEERFRKDVDELLQENLEFWLRFSSSSQQMQRYKLLVQGIQSEIQKLKECSKKQQEGSQHQRRSGSSTVDCCSSTLTSGNGEKPARAEEVTAIIHNHLKELQTDLSVWAEQNALLKQELQTKLAALSNVKKEIMRLSKEEVSQFTAYLQAAKLQGEVLSMQQENNKVADELRAGLDHARGVQAEVEKALAELGESFDLSGSGGLSLRSFRNLSYRTRIPLRSFLFGVKPKPKPKKKKSSIFSCMSPSLQKQYSDLAYGVPQYK